MNVKLKPNELTVALEKLASRIDEQQQFKFCVLISLGNNRLAGYKEIANRYEGKILVSGSVLPWYLWPLKLIAASRTAAIVFKNAANSIKAAFELSPWGMVDVCFFNSESVVQNIAQDLKSKRLWFNVPKALESCSSNLLIRFSTEDSNPDIEETVGVSHGPNCPRTALETLGL